MPDAHPEFVQKLAENLREEAKHLHVHYRGKPLENVSPSQGLSRYPEHGSTASDLLRIADGALCRAKSCGRDRAVVAELAKSDVEARQMIYADKLVGRRAFCVVLCYRGMHHASADAAGCFHAKRTFEEGATLVN